MPKHLFNICLLNCFERELCKLSFLKEKPTLKKAVSFFCTPGKSCIKLIYNTEIIDPNYLPLHYCGIICEIKIIDDGVLIKCKNFMHRYYTFKMDECLIFQKLTSQEQIIINALDHLETTNDESSEEIDTEDNESSSESEDDSDES